MAIIIPSSKTYDRKNPKVRDNVIERIEVGAVEVVPNNDYETPVYNKEFYSAPTSIDADKIEYGVYRKSDDSDSMYGYWIAFSKISSIKYYKFNFDIPRVFNNKYINQLYVGVDKDKNPQIKYTIYYKKTSYSSSMTATFYQNDQKLATYGTISKNNGKETDGNSTNFDFVREYEYPYTPDIGIWTNTNTNKVLLSLQKSPNSSNIRDENILDTSDENYYKISNLMILGEYEQSLLGGWDYGSIGYPENKTITLQGNTTKYIAQKIEITFYGNTIGIDLVDKTVYIPETDTTSKKVFSVESNELMQTSNYILESSGAKTTAIDKMYGKTKTNYENGKETAVIRCSIGDYYDEDENLNISQQGIVTPKYEIKWTTITTLVGKHRELSIKFESPLLQDANIEISISTKKSGIVKLYGNPLKGSTFYDFPNTFGISDEIIETNIYQVYQMSFKENDEVIPMVYNKNGDDQPISFYSGGEEPKKFKVLGVKKYYDGAVWQELTLQEIKKGE